MLLKAIALPDDLKNWQGTAAQLADKVNELLPAVGLEASEGAANERLVRYYVSEGILTEPEPRGRERLFGFQQLTEFIIARQYLADGWPLAKIRDLLRTEPVAQQLAAFHGRAPVAHAPEPTQAEKALQRLKGGGTASPKRSEPAQEKKQFHFMAAMGSALKRAADVTTMRAQLPASLKSLGNAEGKPTRKRMLQIGLTPWCQVQIDADELSNMDASATRILGDALVSALESERLAKGERK